MAMTPEAKRELSSTIRAIRSRLLSDLHDATDSAYRLSVHQRDAGLAEASRARRKRLDDWIKEQERAETGRGRVKRTKEDIRRDAEKQAAYTLLNRLVFMRLLEASGLRKPWVVTGGWESLGYKDFRSLAPALVRGDETEGYDVLAAAGVRGPRARLAGIIRARGRGRTDPCPDVNAPIYRRVARRASLASCWTDDMTLGWVYQYWNDPEREALDAKMNAGGKLAPHEIASKTQMFTERYMVDWLLQNSLGPCGSRSARSTAGRRKPRPTVRSHGWKNGALSGGRSARRARSSLTELMPIHTDAERRWEYYLPQPIPDDAVEQRPESIRDLKLLDPACGSGHFLVIALRPARSRSTARKRGTAARTDGSAGRPGDRREHPREQPPRHRPRPQRRADRRGGALAEG